MSEMIGRLRQHFHVYTSMCSLFFTTRVSSPCIYKETIDCACTNERESLLLHRTFLLTNRREFLPVLVRFAAQPRRRESARETQFSHQVFFPLASDIMDQASVRCTVMLLFRSRHHAVPIIPGSTKQFRQDPSNFYQMAGRLKVDIETTAIVGSGVGGGVYNIVCSTILFKRNHVSVYQLCWNALQSSPGKHSRLQNSMIANIRPSYRSRYIIPNDYRWG